MDETRTPLVARLAGLVSEPVHDLKGELLGNELVRYVESILCPMCNGHRTRVVSRLMHTDGVCYFCGGAGRVPEAVCGGCGLPAGVASMALGGKLFCGNVECLLRQCCKAKRRYTPPQNAYWMRDARRPEPLAAWKKREDERDPLAPYGWGEDVILD